MQTLYQKTVGLYFKKFKSKFLANIFEQIVFKEQDEKVIKSNKFQDNSQEESMNLLIKGSGSKDIKSDRKFNFKFRRAKLNEEISLQSFLNCQQYTSNSILATSNFQGTQFIIKSSLNSQRQTGQIRPFSKENQGNLNVDQQSREGVPHEVEERFRQVIRTINHEVRELYFAKKKLSKEAPFEFNINLVLAMLIVFAAGLAIFTLFVQVNADKQQNEVGRKAVYIFFGFLLLLILVGLFNVIYAVCKPYNFFYFDYEVMNKVTSVLMEHNRSYFRDRKYTIVCDIETTWILLKPLNYSSKKMSDSYHLSLEY